MTRKLLQVISLIGITSIAVSVLVACSSSVPTETPAGQLDVSQAPASEAPSENPNSGAVAGQYLTFETFSESRADFTDSIVVLFFNAAWCSTCKIARDNFEATLDQIPADMVVVLVDFDDSIELRKQYGVTVQHTFVQIDSSDAELKKWSGSTSIQELIEQVV